MRVHCHDYDPSCPEFKQLDGSLIGECMKSGKESPSGFETSLDEALADVRAVMLDRRAKYGPGNILRHGELGVVVRLGDKYERLDHSREVDFADESTDDCVTDIIGYGLVLKLLRSGNWI